jgi:NAD(P)H-dependent FMN reductase
MPVLQLVIASIRRGQLALPVAEWFAECARQHAGFEPQLVDLAEIAFPLSDGSTTVHDANAVVFVTPVNNYEVNAVPKNAIDDLSFERQYKLLGFANNADDASTPIPESVAIDHAGRCIEDGRFVATEAMASSAKAMLDELWRLTPVAAQSI